MKLYNSAASPFVRKVNAVAIHHGIELERVATNPHESPEELLRDNPLSKVPCLVTDDGVALPDSPLICEYLDSIGTNDKLIPDHGTPRWKALRVAAIADGMMDAAVFRRGQQAFDQADEGRKRLVGRAKAAVERGLAALEAEDPNTPLTIGSVGAVCALGYLDFRFPDEGWRKAHPKLAAWYEKTVQLKPFAETMPKG
ncbi:glutathione S-transferase N-terminal domain-containing protein [Sabulicella glaciei]|uniref:Glutathione S-transferase N-terminal domain-containing protein n=1 Tax=Sabulicella glaciei TaxID=2984948 RepID=A0ABT3NUT3_9PROT|nr:glutathione S-transferase N-terminal domain-containing protein [Roseococcus sp. MDT2-1-1]MCW8085916.1 glutathione S-transferase N-terminal domain-containing protein [Roseococcus sp. MDT2-1-1]